MTIPAITEPRKLSLVYCVKDETEALLKSRRRIPEIYQRNMDLLGFYGFFVIMAVVLAHIHSHVWELTCFVVGIVLSIVLNKWLKSVIRDPRPTHPIPLRLPSWSSSSSSTDEKWYQGSETFGYPSGHAQLAFYALTFLGLVLMHRPFLSWLFFFCFFVACITLYQRWKYRRHTVEQLFAGTVLGGLLGLGAFSSVSVLRNWTLKKL